MLVCSCCVFQLLSFGVALHRLLCWTAGTSCLVWYAWLLPQDNHGLHVHDHSHSPLGIYLFPIHQNSRVKSLGLCGSCVGLIGVEIMHWLLHEPKGCECTFICHIVVYFTYVHFVGRVTKNSVPCKARYGSSSRWNKLLVPRAFGSSGKPRLVVFRIPPTTYVVSSLRYNEVHGEFYRLSKCQ